MHIKLLNGVPELYSVEQLVRDNPDVSFPQTVSTSLLEEFNVFSCEQDNQPSLDTSTQYLELGPFVNRENQWYRTWLVKDYTVEQLAAMQVNLVSQVKLEAQRRILSVAPDWKQRNSAAGLAQLAIVGQANWTEEQASQYLLYKQVWDQIEAIRVASDVLEAYSPIPEDFSANSYWP
jgi:hypothetical protein